MYLVGIDQTLLFFQIPKKIWHQVFVAKKFPDLEYIYFLSQKDAFCYCVAIIYDSLWQYLSEINIDHHKGQRKGQN